MANKKRDLSLSINVIVVLILAITMLGLGLAFIRYKYKQSFNPETYIYKKVYDQNGNPIGVKITANGCETNNTKYVCKFSYESGNNIINIFRVSNYTEESPLDNYSCQELKIHILKNEVYDTEDNIWRSDIFQCDEKTWCISILKIIDLMNEKKCQL